MTKRLSVSLLIVFGGAIAILILTRSPRTTNPAPSPPPQVTAAISPDSAPPAVVPPAAPPPPASAPSDTPAPGARATNSVPPYLPAPAFPIPSSPENQPTDLPPRTVMENLRRTFIQYGSMFGGNPVGTNPDITRALAGDNPKQINFLKADGNRVNAQGELIDPWGTPYFFHQLSGTQMEIRSAGPDRIMYTADDLVLR